MQWASGTKHSSANDLRAIYSNPSAYTIYVSGSTYYAESNEPSGTDYNGDDADVLIQQALDALDPVSDGEVRIVDGKGMEYPVDATIEIPSNVYMRNFLFTLEDNSDVSVIQSKDFDTLTGQNKWYVGADGVPHNFGLFNIHIDGNSANNASGNGVDFYGKRFFVDQLFIDDVKDIGFYSECGDVVGQTDWRDMPEACVRNVHIYAPGSHGMQWLGPHDALIDRLFVSGAGGDGFHSASSAGVYNGAADLGMCHVYSCDRGIYIGGAMRGVGQWEAETNTNQGVVMAGNHVQFGPVVVYTNSGVALGITGDNNVCTGLRSTGNGTGLNISGDYNQVIGAFVDQNTGNAVQMDGTGNRFQGIIEDHTGAGDTGVRLGHTAAVSHCVVDAHIRDCALGFFYYTGGDANIVRATIWTDTGQDAYDSASANAAWPGDDDRFDIIGKGDDVGRTINEDATASVADGGNIAHGLWNTPTKYFAQTTVSSEFVSVTGVDGTNLTVAIKQDDGSAGTSQTILWRARV